MAEIDKQRLIKAARVLLDWTQQDLADRTGLALSTVSRFEAGANLTPENYTKVMDVITATGLKFLTAKGEVVGIQFSAALRR